MIEKLIEKKLYRGGLKIAVGKIKIPKPLVNKGFWDLVPVAGLEPARCRQRWILSPLRLPFHHTGRCDDYYTLLFRKYQEGNYTLVAVVFLSALCYTDLRNTEKRGKYEKRHLLCLVRL